MAVARALVAGGPTREELEAVAAFGIRPEDYVREPVAVWPCCWDAVQLFEAMATQWRMGFSGPIGLDYAALPAVMRLTGVPAAHRREFFEDIQIMECGALEALAEKRH